VSGDWASIIGRTDASGFPAGGEGSTTLSITTSTESFHLDERMSSIENLFLFDAEIYLSYTWSAQMFRCYNHGHPDEPAHCAALDTDYYM